MAVLVTAFKPENLDNIKLSRAIKIRVLLIKNHTAAPVDIAPPMGQNHGPGCDNSPTRPSKKSGGREFANNTSPPSKLPPN